MDLYSLPKDMLVKLVATIREDTVREMEDKYKQQNDFLIEAVENKKVVITTCKNKTCNTVCFRTDKNNGIRRNLTFDKSSNQWTQSKMISCEFPEYGGCMYIGLGPFCEKCVDNCLTQVTIDNKTVWCCDNHINTI